MSSNRTPTSQALRPAAAAKKLGIGLSTLWKKIRNDPQFPQPISITPRVTVLLEADLDAYLAELASIRRKSNR